MGFRIVIVGSRAKLECRLNSLVVRGESERRIFLSEINTLIVQSTAVSMTAALLCELVRNGIKVIFCDEKCNPCSELLPYYGSYDTSKRYKAQFLWGDDIKGEVWREIVRRKIFMQAEVLMEQGFPEQADMLRQYESEVQNGDVSNREGHAAKVYFNCIMHEGESRRSDTFLNACLNYGYAVILSAFNREIVAAGYLTQIGIWHDNEFNAFNFACDLMEPLRPEVDRLALSLDEGDAAFKKKMANLLNAEGMSGEQRTTLDLAIRTYTRSVIRALCENDVSLLCFPEKVTWNEL